MDNGAVRVWVTLEDIERGKRGDSYTCPVTAALRRCGYPLAEVGLDVWTDGERDYVLSDEAQRWVAAFDAGERVGPAALWV